MSWGKSFWRIVTLIVVAFLVTTGVAVSDLRYHWSAYSWYTVPFSKEQIAASQKSIWDWVAVLIVPAWIALGGVIVAAVERWREQDEERREQQREEQRRQEQAQQEAILAAFRGDSQAIASVAMLLARNPQLIDASYRSILLMALCTAFLFEDSSRSQAFVLTALRKLSEHDTTYEEIKGILIDVASEFAHYDAAQIEASTALYKYSDRLGRLMSALRS